jgi:UDP-2,3-diacylglucosamine hydrolase
MQPGKNIYFASDLHLGVPNAAASLDRERRFVAWLDHIAPTAEEIFIVGDLFDFWFEYKRAVPRGFTRVLGTLGRLTDQGIPVHFFTGNHDMWVFDYLPAETGVVVHRAPVERTWNNKRFYIGHGDGLGPGDHGYKVLKKVFENPVAQWLFHRLHPNLGIWLAGRSSQTSRAYTGGQDAVFKGKEDEWLYAYCQDILREKPMDYFIFGHRHLPLDLSIDGQARYINLGDWIRYDTFAVFNGQELTLRSLNPQIRIITGQ